MVLTSEGIEDDARTARAQVLVELEKLRRGGGVDLAQVGTHGESLMQLPAVRKSAEQKGIARDLAALEYLRCVAQDKRLLGNDYQRLIWVTMNFEGNPSTLSQRRTFLSGRLEMTAADRSREARAYESYAAHLVSRSVSPCDDPGGSGDDKAWLEALMAVSYRADAAELFQLGLGKLRRFQSDEEAQEEAHRLIDAFPVGFAILGVGHDSSIELVASARTKLLAGAHGLAVLRRAVPLEPATQAMADLLMVSFTTLKAMRRKQAEEIVGRTAFWLEDTSSWSEILRFGRDGVVRVLEPI